VKPTYVKGNVCLLVHQKLKPVILSSDATNSFHTIDAYCRSDILFLMIGRLHVIILLSQLFQGTVAARNKVARISPLPTTKPASGKGKGKKGSLNILELHAFGLSQVSMLNISFFEDETSYMIFNWTNALDGNDTSWYGEAMNGIGSITIIQPHKSHRFTG